LARKILLADDSVTAQNMGRKILADAGYEVVAVNNGSAALKKIAELKPDLVILDVYMPGYSGLEVCQRLKESQETARIPVLLSVGKLEPFKPEEAQRVRADAFIVKPFEASELLSALSKLEDKVVPRAEPSKPGRFARAMAAAEEAGRSRKETASDSKGWSSRIGFPHEKKGPEEKVADDSQIYNPMNRDLRTVVETAAEKSAEKKLVAKEARDEDKPVAKPDEAVVDVAALASAGLPKDVTPEEVAAIAAAAAQIQMSAAAVQHAPETSENRSELHVADAQVSRIQVSETQISETQVSEPQVSETQISETQISQIPISATASPESFERPADRVEGGVASAVREEAANPTLEENKIDAVAAVAAATGIEPSLNAGVRAEEVQDLPVTMAATAESFAVVGAGGSRWTAVPVALEGDEATILLEQEMQKAYAAFAAAEAESALVATAPEVEAAFAENAYSPEVVAPVVESAAAESSSAVEVVAPEVPAAVEAKAEIAPVAEFAEPNPEPVLVAEPVNSAIETVSAEPADLVVPQVQESQPQELPPAHEAEPVMAEAATPEPVMAEPAVASNGEFVPVAGAEDAVEDYRPESEAIKSTAAAWASWRQIRDTRKDGEAEQTRPKEFEVPEPAAPETALAVAAGAEQILQEVSAAPQAESTDVASIVESVLANLRPKLMEEISRKMAEKK
jgi:CheY-like chemotaxis protein